jgi:hypothetical protein
VHEPNITRLPRAQDWRTAESCLRDGLRRLGVPIRHSIGGGCDYAVSEFFDHSDGRLLQVRHVFNIESLAKLLAGDG